jgi:hypothetical protein
MPNTAMVPNTTAEPVDCVSHQAMAKCTSMLPTSEKDWPIHIKKNVRFQFDEVCSIKNL